MFSATVSCVSELRECAVAVRNGFVQTMGACMQTMCRKCAENAVLLIQYSCDSGEGVRKVNVNKEKGMHTKREEVYTWCKLSLRDAVVSPATDSISTMCSVRQ